jgi:scyllo-inositol 2-dehydrogenase (NADP+)
VWGLVDLVVVAAPNRAHVGLATAAIDRGLAVVVDKPLAPSAGEAERLLGAGGRLTVFQNRRWDGDFLTAARLVGDGVVGRVTRFESRYERFRPEVSATAWRERGDPAEGGGLLLDLGAHLVDQACQLFGAPVRVYAEIDIRRPGGEVEDDVFVALEHGGGERSHLWMSSTAPLHGPRLRLSGLAAGFETFGLDPQESQLGAGLRPGAPEFGRSGPGRFVDAAGGREVPVDPGAYVRFYEQVPAWLAGEAPAPVDPLDSLVGLRVLEAARRSAATGRVIALD